MKRALIILIFFCGCSVPRLLPKNFYGSESQFYSLEFKRDNTFKFRYSIFSHYYEYSSGMWKKLSPDCIILNSYIQSNIIPLNVQEIKSDDSKNHLSANFDFGPRLSKSYHCYIYVNDAFFRIIRCDSIENIPLPSSVRKLRIGIKKSYTGDYINSPGSLYTEVYNTKKQTNVHFKIDAMVSDPLFGYHVFKNFKIFFNGNKFILNDSASKSQILFHKRKTNREFREFYSDK